MGSPLKMTVDDDETMIPMNEVRPKPQGMVRSWDQNASLGLRAKRAKSGSFWAKSASLNMLGKGNTYHNKGCEIRNGRHDTSDHTPS